MVDTDGRQNWRCRGRGTIAYLWVRWRGWWYQSMIITLVLDGNRMKSKANPPARPCSPLSAALGDLCATFLPRSRLSGGLGVIKLFWSLLNINFSPIVIEGISDMSSESRPALTNLLLQRVSKPSSAATLCAAAAPSRADRSEHCRDQLEAISSFLLINQSGARCAYIFEIS